MFKRNAINACFISLVIGLMTIRGTYCEYTYFDVNPHMPSVTIIPSPKAKNLHYEVYEDRAATTEHSLVLSDGVGGWNFPSSHMAAILTEATSKAIIESQIGEDQKVLNGGFEYPRLSQALADEMSIWIQNYQDTIVNAAQEFIHFNSQTQKTPAATHNLINMSKYGAYDWAVKLGGAGTLLGCYVMNSESTEPKLRLFQAGDSLAMLMKPRLSDLAEKTSYYVPEFVTDDMQKSFNAPSQLSSLEIENFRLQLQNNCFQDTEFVERDPNGDDNINMYAYLYYLNRVVKEFEFPIFKKDIIILGSDGLFDNVSSPLMVVFFNYVLKYLQLQKKKGVTELKDVMWILDELVNEFHDFAMQEEQAQAYQEYLDLNWQKKLNQSPEEIPYEPPINYCDFYDAYVNGTTLNTNGTEVINIPRQQRVIKIKAKALNKNAALKDNFMASGSNQIEQENVTNLTQQFANMMDTGVKDKTIYKLKVKKNSEAYKVIQENKQKKENKIQIDNASAEDQNAQQKTISEREKLKQDILKVVPAKKADNEDGPVLKSQQSIRNESELSGIITNSGCGIVDFVAYAEQTDVNFINKVPISPCIQNILKKLAIPTAENPLEYYGYQVIATALGGAAYRISKFVDLPVSPFSIRASQFGQNYQGTKEDDIAVIVSGLKSAPIENVPIPAPFDESIQSIFAQLKTDVHYFLANTGMTQGAY